MATTSSMSSSLIMIDNDLRKISIPTSIRHLGVESDDGVLRLYFSMPKMCGDTDLSDFSIRINYLNAKGEGDVYIVDDAANGAGVILFSWLVGRNATEYKGTVHFIVCLKKLNEDGTVDKEFNTTVASLPVLEGLETNKLIVEQNPDLPDLIESLLIKVQKTIDERLGFIENGTY